MQYPHGAGKLKEKTALQKRVFELWWGKRWQWASSVYPCSRSSQLHPGLQQQGWSWQAKGCDYPPPPWERTSFSLLSLVSRPAKPIQGGLEHITRRAADRSRLAQLQGDTAALFSFLKAGYREDGARLFLGCDSERHQTSVATWEILIRKDDKEFTLKAADHGTRCPARLPNHIHEHKIQPGRALGELQTSNLGCCASTKN